MTWKDAFEIVTTAIVALGGGGAIVLGLSAFIGKVWAKHFLEREKHEFNTRLEEAKRELDVLKKTTLRFKNDKILTYRAVVDVVARILATFDERELGTLAENVARQRFLEFNEKRMVVYGYLAMLAPQTVMDAQDKLMDYLLQVATGAERYDWKGVRSLVIILVNEIRMDIAIDKTPIAYNGKL
jgi:hypothetical protein